MPQPTDSPAHSRPAHRLAAFDSLRAVAAVLVILLHAAIAYLIFPLPGLAWPTHDSAPSPVVDAIFWWIEGFIMPLFVLIAGFFAAGLYRKRPAREFLKHRAARLLVPLAFGCVVILPLDLYIWVLGWVADGKVPLRKMLSLKFDGDIGAHLWGFSHLWFLQYLYLYCVGFVVVGWLLSRRNAAADRSPNAEARRRSAARLIDRVILSPWKPLVLAVPCAAVLWFAPQVVTGFQHGFLPFPSKFLYTTVFFAAGIWMERFRGDLLVLSRFHGWYLAASAGAYAVMLPLIRRHMQAGLMGLERLALAGSIALFAWLTVFGLIGLFLRWFDRPNRGLAYVAEASFWIYLLHHPIVGLVQIDLSRVAIPGFLKFWIVVAVATALTLLTYHVLVRYTWVGVLLNGRRLPRPSTVASAHGQPVQRQEPAQREAA